jgi:hypothetical protein
MKKFKLRLLLLLFCLSGLLSCGGSHEAETAAEAASCYKFEFDMDPASGVSNIKAKQIVVGDSVVAWLKFNVSSQDFDLLKARGFFPISYDNFEQELNLKSGNAPSWWQVSNNNKFYKIVGWKKEFSYSCAFISYDVGKNIICFCHTASN